MYVGVHPIVEVASIRHTAVIKKAPIHMRGAFKFMSQNVVRLEVREAINNCQTFALTGVNDRICVNYTCINTHVVFCRVGDEHLTIVNCFYVVRLSEKIF